MRVAGANRLGTEFGGTGYLLTASLAAAGGYAVAAMRYAPRIAQLAKRVDDAEHSLFGQGQAIHELSEALRSLLSELEGTAASERQDNAIAAAKWALSRR